MASEPLWLRMHVGPTVKDGHAISACTDPTHWVPVEPEADELCPYHKSAYLFNFKTWKSYCAHCGEEVERVSDGD